MSEVTQAAESPASRQQKPLDYDAFLSYTHRDRPVVSGIQKGLHRIGRRLGQLRALRVFRDDTDLAASPDLWGRITEALDRSRFFVVTLSPGAAASHWVNQEISYWLEHRGRDQLLLVLAAGQLRWDQQGQCFDPGVSDAAPPVLRVPGSLPVEPLFIDVSADAPWDFRGPVFREKITALAAPIHGKPKDQLASDDLREQRRFRRLRAAAIAGLVVLTVAAVVAAIIAVAQRQEALRQRNQAIAQQLVSDANGMLAGSNSGGDARAFREVLAARALAGDPDNALLLHALDVRTNTLKIIDTDAPLNSAAISPDGHRLASASADHTVRLWDADTGQPLGQPLTGHTNSVTSVVFSPDGHRLTSASGDKTVRLWDADTGQPLQTLTGHTNVVFGVAFSPEGHRLASASWDDTVRLWNADTGQPIGQPLTGHTNRVNKVAFSPDGHRLASASSDNTVRLWNVDSGQPIGQPLTGHTGTVNSVAFSPEGHRLATGGEDDTVRFWNADTGQPIGEPSPDTRARIWCRVQPRRPARGLRRPRRYGAAVARCRYTADAV
jgi:WD domain, G-beta repeat/TIR domain